MAAFVQDVLSAARRLRKSPAFLVTAVLTLALGIGANTAVFTVVNAVLLRALPYPNADRLTLVWSSAPSQGLPQFSSAAPDYRQLRSDNHTFENMGAFSNDAINLSLEGQAPEVLISSAITASLFPTIGVRPFLGRDFTEQDEEWGKHRVAILSYGLWERSFGADRSIVGRQVHLGGELYTVVGVMPKDFRLFRRPVVIWTPLAYAPKDEMNTRDNHYLWILGRLKEGVTQQQADTDVRLIFSRMAQQYPENVGISGKIQSVRDNLSGDVRPALLALFGAVFFVLLVACVNLANLMLSRAASRQKEFAVRSAMGASRGRLISQFMAESLLLAVTGAAAGLIVGSGLVRLVVALLPAGFPNLLRVHMDPTVLAFTAALALSSVLLFGILPAFESSGVSPQQTLHESTRGATLGRRARGFRAALVVTELALATTLLAGAGLLLKSFSRLQHQDFGFDPQHVLTFGIPMDQARYTKDEDGARFVGRVLERVQSVPGVRAAGMVNTLPLGYGMGWGKMVSGEGFAPMHSLADVPTVNFNLVSPDYFSALGARLRAGRYFTNADNAKSQPVAIVNQSFVRRYYPHQEALGKTIRMLPPQELLPPPTGDAPVAPFRTVVGVVEDLKNTQPNEPTKPEVFVPYTQFSGEGWGRGPMIAVRTEGDPGSVAGAIRAEISSLDSLQPMADVTPMSDRIQTSVAQSRFNAMLLALFAGLAVALAAVGIYGVISYGVSRRTQEIGVRMALGATRRTIVEMILRESMRLTAYGMASGLLLALALARLITTLLFGVRTGDPTIYFSISAIIAVVALLATLIPAQRAARLEPMQALRTE